MCQIRPLLYGPDPFFSAGEPPADPLLSGVVRRQLSACSAYAEWTWTQLALLYYGHSHVNGTVVCLHPTAFRSGQAKRNRSPSVWFYRIYGQSIYIWLPIEENGGSDRVHLKKRTGGPNQTFRVKGAQVLNRVPFWDDETDSIALMAY